MSKILYIRISDEDWQLIAEEAKQRDTNMVRAVIRVLKRGLACSEDQTGFPPKA